MELQPKTKISVIIRYMRSNMVSKTGKSSFFAIFFFFVCILILSSKPCLSYVIEITLTKMIKISDYIILGKVRNIVTIGKTRYAVIDVVRTLRAKSRVGRLLYRLYDGFFACDITTAIKGETALFFVKDSDNSDQKPPGDGKRIVSDIWSGRGRMPVSTVKGREFVALWTATVILPKCIENTSIPDQVTRFSSKKSVPLDEMLEYMEKVINRKGGGVEDYDPRYKDYFESERK